MKEVNLPYSKEKGYINQTAFPSGEIDITENGEYDVYQYAKANVNVEGGGSSDLSIAEVTVVVDGDPNTDVPINVPICNSVEGFGTFAMASTVILPNETTEVILYNGKCITFVTGDEHYNLSDFNVTGNATLDKEQGLLTITGDCTISCVYTPLS